jgi:hypothetical protein
MTFAEVVLFAATCLAFYFLLAPIRKKLEKYLYKFLANKQKNNIRDVIDITDYTKKNDPK